MRRVVLLIAALITSSIAVDGLGGQQKDLAVEQLPEFLARYRDGLRPLDSLYTELAEERLPLREEGGQLLTRRYVEDRRQALDELRRSVAEFDAAPLDLIAALRLFLQSEALADDLFDLAQIAYDNNREELGRRLSQLQGVMDHHNALLESYALNIAGESQRRLRALESENADLRKKLATISDRGKAREGRQP
jgi:hypothetical protein